jgi:hypothetical protein
MKQLIGYFIKFLWHKDSLNAFSVVMWIQDYMDKKTCYDAGQCLIEFSKQRKT